MRLTLLTPTLDQSGAEKQLTLLACGLKESTDWEIEVLALTRGGPFQQVLEEHGIEVTILQKRWRFDPFCLAKLRRHLKRHPPDLLHTWMFSANAYGRLAAGARPPFKVICSERCVDSWKAAWQLRVDRYLIERTDKLLANSQSVADFYREVGYPNSKIAVIPNGVPTPPPRDPSRREQLHREWGLPDNARVVAYIGRLARQKRVNDLMWSFQLFQQLSDNTYFLIIGDGPERAWLEDLSIRYTCDHLVRFVGHQPQASALLDGVDLFWLGSDFEGMSNSLMEAMAAGIPAIASDIPANRELVVPELTGDLFPVGNRTALAQMSDRILNQPEIHQSMSRAAAEHMKSNFRIDLMVGRHQELYQQVLSSD